MAEIEVVGEGGGGGGGGGVKQGVVEVREARANGGEGDPVVDVYSAAAYGDLERLRGFVERDGGASLAAPDGNGYHALQWATLNNYPHVALYIIEVQLLYCLGSSLPSDWGVCSVPFFFLADGVWYEQHGGDVNAGDNAQQTALHWAAVRGAIAAADVLLENGARVEAADVNGYRVMQSFCCSENSRWS